MHVTNLRSYVANLSSRKAYVANFVLYYVRVM